VTSFPAPADFEVPDNIEAGDTFEAMAELRLEPDGRLTLVGLDGYECGCKDTEEDEDEDEGPESGPHKGKSFVNQVEIKFGSAGLD
jgi:hypothetical protein